MRVILKCNRYTPIKLMLDTLQWISVFDLIKLHSLVFIFKIKTRRCPDYLKLQLNNEVHSYPTRSNDDIRPQRATKQITFRSIFNEGVRLYNNLPNSVKNSRSASHFKSKCLRYLRECDNKH